jgi:hypothetical protein
MWVLALLALLPRGSTGLSGATFEPPVLVGESVGAAINASCGAGRFWFPAGGYSVDGTTLAVEVSLFADGDTCTPTDGTPHTIVSASFDGGRSWRPHHFVGKSSAPHWHGIPPGPSFCGASGVTIATTAGGIGLLCPGDAAEPAFIDSNGTGVLKLSATIWTSTAAGANGSAAAAAAAAGAAPRLVPQQMPKQIVLRCPPGAHTLPGGWGPGPVRPPTTQGLSGPAPLFRVATCATPPPAGAKKSTNATQVIMRSDDNGWTWETISTIPPWHDVYLHGTTKRRPCLICALKLQLFLRKPPVICLPLTQGSAVQTRARKSQRAPAAY